MADTKSASEHIEDIIIRLKNVYGVGSDRQLTIAMEIDPTSVSTWRKRTKIPFREIYNVALTKRVSIDWVVFGKEADQLLKGHDIDPAVGV